MMQLQVGPICRPKTRQPYQKIKAQVKKMKIGEYFEVSGIASEQEVARLRNFLSYQGRKQRFKVSTRLTGTKMKIERVSA